MQKQEKALTLKTLNKSNVWDVQENDIFRLWQKTENDGDAKESARHYMDIVRTAFNLEILPSDDKLIASKYEKMGYKIGRIKKDENNVQVWAVRKRPIVRVSDLTYENILHISAAKLLEVIDRNFGGGWDSLSQSIQDIIESGFDISTTTLPKDRLHKPGGLYEKKVADGYEVLEVAKGTWVEAIFAKVKPQAEKPRLTLQNKPLGAEDGDDDEEYVEKRLDDDEDEMEMPEDFDGDDITEENYSTMVDIATDPEEEADALSDDL
ncbi:MAG: hypothetical protein ACI3YL_03470 [Prevotella sp.]